MNQQIKTLLDAFRHLSEQPFSPKRENAIDDVFAGLLRLKFESGKKHYDDENHPTTRIRMFTYHCNDKKHRLLVKVIIVKGEPGKSQFIIEEKF